MATLAESSQSFNPRTTGEKSPLHSLRGFERGLAFVRPSWGKPAWHHHAELNPEEHNSHWEVAE
jgi:hypothetical protein